jgi:ATP-dependent helicase Lhr and Lhr-like helicase
MILDLFQPLIVRWFSERFHEPTAPQAAGWAAIAGGRHTLIAAPTGSGKTLAAFLWSINTLVTAAATAPFRDETAVLYVSPLRALGNDIHRNLTDPLTEIRRLAEIDRTPLPEIRVAVRSGDTPARERALMVRRPPHILITTPESLYILLTAERSREFLATVRTVIVDEIHAIAGDKRGAHLALSLERLDLLTGRRCQRIGLSATQKPIDQIARLLTGCSSRSSSTSGDSPVFPLGGSMERPPNPDGGAPDCAIVDIGHRRAWELAVEVPGPPRGPIGTQEMWEAVYDRIAALIRDHRTTIIFVNTRRLVERVAHHLTFRWGEGRVAAHHGSLARRIRLDAEQRLKTGQISAVVATTSLELGIDIGHVDLVCHLGAPRALATLLQRVGRSGHWLGSVPKGILFPMTLDELIQCAAAVRAVRAGALDGVVLADKPLDILAQQVVATVATGESTEDDLYTLVRTAYPYRSLGREEFNQILEMVSEGPARRLGRTTAHLHRDRIHGVLRPRRGARLAAITSGGAIPDTADYDVVLDPEGVVVGSVNEDFAVESMAGDVFLLGNASWRIRRVEAGRVRVEDARGVPPSVPFWLGEAPARTPELSSAVSSLRVDIAARLGDREALSAWLIGTTGIDAEGAAQIADYVAETERALGCVPSQRAIVAERFFDEAGGMQVVLHAPFGARINRAWGLALRKRFCLTFDFELQAAATDDGIVLSLGQQHSFPLQSLFGFLRTQTFEEDLIQALLASPLFTTRWRWNATRALALLRHSRGRRVPMPIQRMRAEDLLAAVFPEQVACQDNRTGPITPPDHPLVNETIRNCLAEAMDVDGLRAILGSIERGELRTVSVETPAPSPMSHEILNANPYAFLDDAPLEERRARAVALRRTDPDLARGAGALDPAAIEEVASQAWPDVRSADDLHDHLSTLGLLPAPDAAGFGGFANALVESGRAVVAEWRDPSGNPREAFVAMERVPLVRAALPDVRWRTDMQSRADFPDTASVTPDDAIREIVHGWLQCAGPITAADLGRRLGIATSQIDIALAALEGTGAVLRGQFTPGSDELEWCERRLLARIHRLTLGRLRREIEPVSPSQLMRFLLRWQHIQPDTQLHGRDGVAEIIGMLQGMEIPAPAWEEHVLPSRVRLYDPADLDALCLGGTITWGRLTPGPSAMDPFDGDAPPPGDGRRWSGPPRSVPIAFMLREDLPAFVDGHIEERCAVPLRGAAADVVAYLRSHGASFLPEITRGVRRLPAEVEPALWELVALGLVSGDGLAGLRRLITGNARSRSRYRRALSLAGAHATRRPLPAGRWALWGSPGDPLEPEARNEILARQFLRRYGVVLRDLLARERSAPPWRVLSAILRRWEAEGQIRGGRFVAGFTGEQFALPGAVEMLRAVRRAPDETEEVVISAADPLNLAGIILPGTRVSPLSGLAIALRNGVVVDVAPQGALLARLGRIRTHRQTASPPA